MSLKRNKIGNEVIVTRDGQAALDHLLGEGRTEQDLPMVVLLDLKLRRSTAWRCFSAYAPTARTKLLPVVVLTSSDEEKTASKSYGLGANSLRAQAREFRRILRGRQAIGLYWFILNRPARD